MRKTWMTLLAMIVTIALSACSGGGISEDATKYIATTVSMLGIEMAPADISDEDIVLALDKNGKAELSLDGKTYSCEWEEDDSEFTLSQGSDEFTGTMNGDVVTIENLLDMGLDIVFLKEGADPVEDEKPEEPEEPEEAEDPPVPEPPVVPERETPAGLYRLSSMDMYGVEMTYPEIKLAEMEMTLDFRQDGTVEMNAFGDILTIPVDYENNIMEIDGLDCDFTIEDDQITIYYELESTTMVMTAENSDKWAELEAEVEDFVTPGYGAETTISVKSLSNPSSWYGTITISDYVGEYDYMEGTHEAWACIDSYEGRPYFEMEVPGIYDNSDLVVSFYIDLDTFTFRPVVDGDSWIFDRDVTEDDATLYAAYLMHGLLTASLDYESDVESFQFDYELAMIEGSDVVVEEPTTEPEPSPEEPEDTPSAVIPESLTKAQLLEAFDALEALPREERTKLTYEDVVATYLHGIEGEVYHESEDYMAYLWRSQESETSLIQIDFNMDENGVWGCGNRYTANMG